MAWMGGGIARWSKDTKPYFLSFLGRLSNRRTKTTTSAARPPPPPSHPSSSDSESDSFDKVNRSSVAGRPLSEILKQLNKRVPDNVIRVRNDEGFTTKYIPWHIVNRIMNLHAPEWSGEVRSITYSTDGKSVSVVYRVTIFGCDAEIYRESIGTTTISSGSNPSFGDPIQKAEATAFRRACARLGLGLHLYHEDMM